MTRKIKLTMAEELKEFMNLAWNCKDDIGVHTHDRKIADAKSILGLISLDYSEPVTVVTENEEFFEKIKKWIVD